MIIISLPSPSPPSSLSLTHLHGNCHSQHIQYVNFCPSPWQKTNRARGGVRAGFDDFIAILRTSSSPCNAKIKISTVMLSGAGKHRRHGLRFGPHFPSARIRLILLKKRPCINHAKHVEQVMRKKPSTKDEDPTDIPGKFHADPPHKR